MEPTRSNPPPATTPFLPPVLRRRLSRRWRWIIISALGVLVVILGVSGWIFYRAIAVVNTQKLNGNERVGFWQQVGHIVSARNDQLQGEAEDRINVLLLGYGGPGHDGPYLTDTMMVASVKPSTKDVALLSIPRDLVVNIPKYGYRKINSVLSAGRDQKYPGGGEAMAVKVVSDTLNIPIQYYARVDFQGFADIIDRVGGVTVTVDRAFTDYSYPTSNYGYQTVRFKTGEQAMSGDLALKFARSRHGNNGEGSDFARAKRQQKIMVALKDKILSAGTLLNPLKVSDILGSLGSHTQTNLEVWEMLRLADLVKGTTSEKIINKVIQDGPTGLVKSATGLGGAFILVPKAGSYVDLQFLAKNIFTIGAADRETAPIMVVNASKITNLGQLTAEGLAGFGLTVTKTTAYKTSLAETVLIDGTAGQSSAAINVLKEYRHTIRVLSPADWADATGDTTLLKYFEPPVTNTSRIATPKLILVLGADQPKPSASLNVPTQTKTTNTNKSAKTTNKNTNKNTNTAKTNKNTNTAINTNSTNTNTATNTNTSTNTNTAVDTNTSINTNVTP